MDGPSLLGPCDCLGALRAHIFAQVPLAQAAQAFALSKAGTVAGNNIYVGGGLHTTFDAFGSRNDSVVNFRRFNATTRAVVGLYDIPAALTYGAMVAHPNGRIYWIGGRRDSTVTPTALVWAYVTTLDQWWQ